MAARIISHSRGVVECEDSDAGWMQDERSIPAANGRRRKEPEGG
jgi:hypothetical protein